MPENDPAKTPNALARDRIRESAKWLVASAGSIGAVVFAGVSLSAMGKLDASQNAGRLLLAIVGVAVAVAGVAVVLNRAVSVLIQGSLTFAEVKEKYDAGNKRVIGCVEHLIGKESCAIPLADIPDFTALAGAYNNQSGLDEPRSQSISNRKQLIVDMVSTTLMRDYFRRATVWIVVGLMGTALGVATYAWAANPPAEVTDPPSPEFTPQMVSLTLNETPRGELQPQFVCTPVPGTLPAILLSMSKDGDADVVTLETDVGSQHCASVRISVSKEIGTLTAVNQLQPSG